MTMVRAVTVTDANWFLLLGLSEFFDEAIPSIMEGALKQWCRLNVDPADLDRIRAESVAAAWHEHLAAGVNNVAELVTEDDVIRPPEPVIAE